MSKLKEKLMLSEKGYSDLKKAITACTITNIALLLPSMVACLLFWELLKPFTGETISWAALWKLLGLGLVAAILVFLAAKNDYRKTYIASYKEASTTRLRIAEHLRKLPMSFFNTKDLSDITTNMMADCSSMESMLSSTIPPLIANIISVTLTCICLAFFDWRMALAIFCTMPVTFLIILGGRKLQLHLFDKQVDVKLEASSQIQEYLEGIKIIKSCGLGGRTGLRCSGSGSQPDPASRAWHYYFHWNGADNRRQNRIAPSAGAAHVLHADLRPDPCHSLTVDFSVSFGDCHQPYAYPADHARYGGRG